MVQSRSIQKTCVAVAVAQAISFNVSEAATFRVTNGFDEGIGCTMRDALENINNGVSAPTNGCLNQTGEPAGTNDTIELGVSTVSSLTATLEITNDVAINPSGGLRTFLGNSNDRVFKIDSSTVTMNSVSIRNGLADDGNDNQNLPADSGGGIYISSNTNTSPSTLTLSNSTITGNSANRNGGGIYSISSELILENTTVSANSANNFGAGALVSTTTLSIVGSTLSGNSAASFGGGIHALNSPVDIRDTAVRDNKALAGAGISAQNSSIVEISNSSLSANTAMYSGGGLSFAGGSSVKLTNTTVSNNTAEITAGGGVAAVYGNLSIVNSTIANNRAPFGSGAGLEVSQTDTEVINSTISNNEGVNGSGINVRSGVISATLRLLNSTITGNQATLFGGGVEVASYSIVSLSNTIIAGNSAPSRYDIFVSPDSYLVNNGFNLIGDSSLTNDQSFSIALNPNDITATSDGSKPTALSSIIEALADNGGPTATHALVAESPAIDAANNTLCAAAPINNQDQRGITRSGCDIGSFELQEETSSFFVIPLPNGKSVVIEL